MDELMKDQVEGTLPKPLSEASLAQLPKDIGRPTYDRRRLTPGIIHIGLGNFHRAHQAWYVHRLMQMGKAHDWGIIGAGVRPYDEAQRQRLAAQDYLTTLIELDPTGVSSEIVGSIIGYVPVQPDNRELIKCMADPAIRIVSLTVTEGGYYLDPATKKFDCNSPDIRFDATNPSTPRTAFGAIVAALAIRRQNGLGPFTCQSCDNLPGNGNILRAVVLGLAEIGDPTLADWITENVSFPNSMVDCIVPATGSEERTLARSLGVLDEVPVTHERFRQWVIEDDFCAGRPAWEAVGVTHSDQVHAHEAMKLRILNGGHQIIAAPAEILGARTIAEAMQVLEIRQYFRKVSLAEIADHVCPVPGMGVTAYLDLIDARFSNTAIQDTVRRVAFDGSARHTGAVLPVIRDAISKGAPIEGLALSQALWARMCAGTREDGSEISPNDPSWEALTVQANAARSTPMAWLGQSHIYGDVVENEEFSNAFEKWLTLLYDQGVSVALQRYNGQS